MKVLLSPVVSSIITALVVLGGVIAGLIVLANENFGTSHPEIIIGMVIVLGVSALVFLLYVLAVGFNTLKLADPKQALGLPVGSIRAMIALMLILIWVILSVYIFSGTLPLDSSKNADSIRLAQQLYTTMSTLVVAIAAFYFGSSSVKAAQSALARATSQPIIDSISPTEGRSNQPILFTISGKGFLSPVAVKLVKDSTDAAGTSILSNDTTVQCTIQLPASANPGDRWDVVVVNSDGGLAQLKGAFTVQP